jgi:hypothetical protein
LKNAELIEKWKNFVKNTAKDKNAKEANFNKFSSICSQHFKDSDFCSGNKNETKVRKFLKKDAFPSIIVRQQPHNPISGGNDNLELVIQSNPTESYELCGLCRKLSLLLNFIDDNNFSIMRKCLPLFNFNLSFMQKICSECLEVLNNFSNFIDKIIVAQNLLNIHQDIDLTNSLQPAPLENHGIQNIKSEPITIEDEQNVMPFIHPVNFNNIAERKPTATTNQKKCEILEIVDIKPINFLPFETNALNSDVNETNSDQNYVDQDDIQILSPNQLKVEINDYDADNELEMIKNYMLISCVSLHDHTYVKELEKPVKIELEDDSTKQVSMIKNYLKICCKKKIKSPKKYLCHKLIHHQKKTYFVQRLLCNSCNKRFLSQNCLKKHVRHCKKNYIRYKKYVINLRKKIQTKQKATKRGKLKHTCQICFKSFKGSKNLYQHKMG